MRKGNDFFGNQITNASIAGVNSKDYLYTADNYDFSDYLGCEVTYYYRKADDENQILSMVMSKSAEPPLKLSFEYITGAENDLSSITYIKSGKEKEAKISKRYSMKNLKKE